MHKDQIVKLWELQWRQAGLKEGDLVLIHSSISRTMRKARARNPSIAVEDLLQSFLSAVGNSGTLLFPLFNFGFTKGVTFDLKNTPSEMGALTESARIYPSSFRTGHPIYSFAAIGAQSEVFKKVSNYSGYGQDSPFAILRNLNGKIAILDLDDQNSMTFYHHVEELEQVPYRYHKIFRGPYIGIDGLCTVHECSLFVRDLANGVETNVNRMGELLWSRGLYTGSRPGEGPGLRVIDAVQLFQATSEVIRSGKALQYLYSINKGCK